jgi:heat-inducible transcriptional repressor
VIASYDLGNNTQGLNGVVGPTRMDYAKVAAYLSYIASGMKRYAISGEVIPLIEKPPDGEERDDG